MKTLRKIVSLLPVPLLWLLYLISYLIPRDPRLVAFGVHTESLSGNVPALLDEVNPGVRKVFIARRSSTYRLAIEKGFPAYNLFSMNGVLACLKAGSYIYSGYPSDVCFWTSGGARLINAWHGTPVKMIERDIDRGYYSFRNKVPLLVWVLAPYLRVRPDKLLVASEYEEECFTSAFDVRSDVFERCFPPRLSRLEFTRDGGGPIILYAPTWRDDHSYDVGQHINLDKMSQFLVENDLRLFIKLHPSDSRQLNCEGLESIHLVPSHADIYDYLCMAEMVVTDFSSLVFEAIYLKIGVALFYPDRSSYLASSRDLYFDHAEILGLEVARDQSELQVALLAVLGSNEGTVTGSDLPRKFLPYPANPCLLHCLLE